MGQCFYFFSKLFSGLAVHLYPDGKDPVVFTGVKNEEGFSKFLIKNLGDTILVGSMMMSKPFKIHF